MLTLVAAVALLVVRNVAGEIVPSALYVPVNVVLAIGLVVIASASGLSTTELGLSRSSAPRGMAVGAVVAIGAALVIAVAAAAPQTRPLFEDQRMDGVDGPELAYLALVRIPLGTALLEEVAFRGVLLAMLHRLWSTAGAVAVSSVLFGLWHIRPTLSALETNDLAVEPLARVAAVVGAVVVTAIAGVLFCRVRRATDSVLAPVVVHATINSSSAIAAYVVIGAR